MEWIIEEADDVMLHRIKIIQRLNLLGLGDLDSVHAPRSTRWFVKS